MKNKPPFRGVVDGKRHCRFCDDTTKEITE